MTGNRHSDALSAFESDSQFEGIHSALTEFQRKQKKKTKTKSEHFEWIIEEKRLKNSETVVLKQLSNSISILLIELGKEETSRGYNPVSFLEDGIVAFETSSSAFEQQSGVLKKAIASLSINDTGDGVKRDGFHAQAILDMKRNLSVINGELDQQCRMLQGKIKECNRAVFQHSAEQSNEKNCNKADQLLPQSLIEALADANIIENKITQLGDGDGDESNVTLLERKLKEELAAEKTELDMALAHLGQSTQDNNILPELDEQSNDTFRSICSAFKKNISLLSRREHDQLVKRLRSALQKSEEDIISYIRWYESQKMYKAKERAIFQEYTRRRLGIEKKGLKDIESLVNDLERRIESIEAKKQNQIKMSELRLRIRAQRAKRDDPRKIKKSFHNEDSMAHSRMKNEIDLLEKSLNAKQVLWAKAGKKQETAFSMQTELTMEASRLSKHRANKDRTNHREEERKNKIEIKRSCNIASSKAEERRLERLRALAATVPYYQNIVNTTPDIYKTTEARKNDVYTTRDASLADFQCGLQQLKSFTTEKIFSDPKFRLANALHEAGVAQSTYARDVIRCAIPRAQERITGMKPY